MILLKAVIYLDFVGKSSDMNNKQDKVTDGVN